MSMSMDELKVTLSIGSLCLATGVLMEHGYQLGSALVEYPLEASSGIALIGGLVIAGINYPKKTLAVAGTVAAAGLGVFAMQYWYNSSDYVTNLQVPALRDNLAHAYNSWKNDAPMCEPCVVQTCPTMFATVRNVFRGWF